MNDALVLVFNSSRLSLGAILFCFIFFSVFSFSTGDDKTDESFFLNAFESQPSSLSYSLLSGISTIREFQFRKLLRSAKCIRAIPGVDVSASVCFPRTKVCDDDAEIRQMLTHTHTHMLKSQHTEYCMHSSCIMHICVNVSFVSHKRTDKHRAHTRIVSHKNVSTTTQV